MKLAVLNPQLLFLLVQHLKKETKPNGMSITTTSATLQKLTNGEPFTLANSYSNERYALKPVSELPGAFQLCLCGFPVRYVYAFLSAEGLLEVDTDPLLPPVPGHAQTRTIPYSQIQFV